MLFFFGKRHGNVLRATYVLLSENCSSDYPLTIEEPIMGFTNGKRTAWHCRLHDPRRLHAPGDGFTGKQALENPAHDPQRIQLAHRVTASLRPS
jgi:hypothetical protein